MPCTWWLSWLAVERPWSALFYRGTISATVGSFQLGAAFAGRKALAIESLLMSGCGQSHEPPENASKKLWLRLALTRSEKYEPKEVSIA